MSFWKNLFGRGEESFEDLSLEDLEIKRKTMGETHRNYAAVLNDLASRYQDAGNYAQAEPLYRQAIEIRRKALGEDHPYYAIVLNNLATLYQDTGDYERAAPLYSQALQIRWKAEGEVNPALISSLQNLGSLFHYMGDYASAEPLCQLALECRRKLLGEDHPDYATSLNNMGDLYQAKGEYARAEPFYRRALEVRRKVLGEDHPNYASSLNNLALLYDKLGDYGQAELLVRQVLEVRRKALGEDHPDFATSLNSLAGLYAATRREAEALTLMKRAAGIEDRIIGQIFSLGSEARRMAYLNTLLFNFAALLSLVLNQRSRTSTAAQIGLDRVLRRKAIGAEALAVQQDAILGQHYPQLAAGFRQLSLLRSGITQQTLSGPGPEGPEVHRQVLAELTARKEQLEVELAESIPEMNLEQHLRKVDRQSVADALPEESVLVEFVYSPIIDFEAVPARGELRWKSVRYLAFILPAGKPDEVQMIDLGEAKPIEGLIADFRASITGEAERSDRQGAQSESVNASRASIHSDPTDPRKAILATRNFRLRSVLIEGGYDAASGVALREALFDPILPALKGRRRLFLAPDGDLARVPFEALPGSHEGHLIDEYEISYLGVGRDVLRFGAESDVQSRDPLVAADPDFDLQAANEQGFSAGTPPFERLRGTRVEGERIAGLLGVAPLLGSSVLENSIKGVRSPYVLHIATHGFFLPDQKRYPEHDLIETEFAGGLDNGGVARLARAKNPLVRSGLALAGANTYLNKEHGSLPAEAEDGLLTAEDVTGMDLLATELAVLSACETGLGEVRVGEGVYGLRRAFVLAGANTLVMSLWKVPDEQTQELMEHFYRKLLEGQPRAGALRKAQLMMKEKYSGPLYWGAFVCQGDPGPLPPYPVAPSDTEEGF